MGTTPRVSLRYKAGEDKGGALREIPFVIGVLGRFSGAGAPRATLWKRSFTSIDADSFDAVRASMEPHPGERTDALESAWRSLQFLGCTLRRSTRSLMWIGLCRNAQVGAQRGALILRTK